MSNIIRSLLIRVGVDLKDQQKGLTVAAANMKAFGRNATKIGASLTKGLTVPILAIGAMSLKSAIDFESAFAGVRKTVDATEEQFAALERGIRNMSKEIPTAATDIAAVAEAAGQLGIQTDNILGFTRVMVDLGEATNMTATEGAETLAKFANITQMSQKDFDRLGSSIVALGNSTATTEADIANMSMRLAGAGKQVGMTEPQILGFAAALSSVGVEAEAGGSAMSKVMVNMQLAASKGGESLQQFADVAGMTAAEFKEAYQRDAAGALTAFIQGLGDMKAQGKDAIVVLDDMGITEVRMRDALLRAANAGDMFTDTIKISTDAWRDNVALTNEAAQRYDTTESQLRILLNRLVDLGRTLGNSLIPVLRNSLMPALEGVVRALGSVLDGFNNLSPFMQNFIIMTAGVAASIGPVMTVLGKLSFSLADTTKGLGAAVKIIEGGGGFKAALTALLGPAGMVAAAIAGLALAIGAGVIIFQSINAEGIALNKTLDETIAKAKEAETAFAGQNTEIEHNSILAKKLADELYALSGKEEKSAAEKMRMQTLVKQLNEMYGDLNLTINEGTGLLNKSRTATLNLIDAKERELKFLAYEERMKQIYMERINLEIILADATEALTGTREKLTEAELAALRQGALLGDVNYKLMEAYHKADVALQQNAESIRDVEDGYRDLATVMASETSAINASTARLLDTRDWASGGYSIGAALMEGIAKGIADKESESARAADAAAKRVMSAIKTRVQPGSPSKVTTEWGRNIMQGFSKGMGEALSRATQGARDATMRLMGSIGNAIGGTALQMPRLATAGNYAAPTLSSGGYAASTDDLAADGMASAFVRALQQYGLKVDANGRVIGQIASEYIEAERRNTTLGRGGVL